MATTDPLGDGSVLIDSRFKISDGVVNGTKALRECLFLLKVLTAAGLFGWRGLGFKCSAACKMAAFDPRASVRITEFCRRMLKT